MIEKPESTKNDNDPLGLDATFDTFNNLTEAEEAEIIRNASHPEPLKTEKVEVYDTELGWVTETVMVTNDEPATFYEKSLNASLDAPILTAVVKAGKVVREFVYQKQGNYRASGAAWGLVGLTVAELKARSFTKRAEYEWS